MIFEGVGYHLTITKTSTCDVDRLSGLIKSEIPMAHMVNDEAEEVVFALPSQEASKFEALFESLETNGTTLGVISFGVSVTTMEDVFLRRVNQQIKQSINQSINQSISQSVSQSISQSINQSVSQSIKSSLNIDTSDTDASMCT